VSASPAGPSTPRTDSPQLELAVAILLALPLVGLVVLLAAPSADGHWEHHPSHFWLVLVSAIIPAALGWVIGTAACRRSDARLFLMSLAFFAAAAFLGLHALATPKVLLDASNAGFVVAVPIGLLISSGYAAWSAVPLGGEQSHRIVANARWLRATLTAVVVVWGVWSLASLPPLDDPNPPESGSAWLFALAVPGVALYGFAAYRYLGLARARGGPLLLAVAASWVLLAEAMLAVTVARNWRASWWEWHLLMLVAFGAIAWAVRRLPESEKFSDLYLDDVAGGTREITVLFADLEGFTRFSEANTPAAVQALLNRYFEAVLPAVHAEGGRVDRFIGDAVMVTFNVASEQPDHATLAARAALAFQTAAAVVVLDHPDWPRFRVGVNTGEARVGVVGGAGERGYTVLGDTVNVAARLEGLAPVGGVAIGGDTLRALTGAQVTALGEITVKGRTEPVEVWQLHGLAAR
jgi:class 3 adenylate cyclase